jgi:hypothetical protein
MPLRFPRTRFDQADDSHLRFFHLNQQQLTTISPLLIDEPLRLFRLGLKSSKHGPLLAHSAATFNSYGFNAFILSNRPLQSSSLERQLVHNGTNNVTLRTARRSTGVSG